MYNEQIEELKNKLNAVEKAVNDILNIVKNQGGESHQLSRASDGTISGVFRVMTDPKQWPSGKGAFLSCKVSGANNDDWYTVSLTNNVASKVSPSYFPTKGDTIAVTGKYEEKNENGKTYRSIFAFRVTPGSAAPATKNTKQFDDNEDLPF